MSVRLAVSFLSIAAVLGADTLTLKNGSTINGRFVGGDGRAIRFAVGGQVNTYDVIDIDALRFTSQESGSSNSNNYPPAPPSPPSSYPPPSNYPSNSASNVSGPPSDSSAPNYPPPPQQSNVPANNMELPSGTQITVRLIDGVDSHEDHVGQTYRASVDRPVVVNGQTLIPRGSDAIAVLAEDQKSGKIQGKTVLTISLRSVTVGGKTYDLATSNVNKSSGSRGAKSGEVIGGTAALGAIIGALAGGGRGAAIGAVSGGALGTGVQVATSGERVKIPSETMLTFALQNPLYISESY